MNPSDNPRVLELAASLPEKVGLINIREDEVEEKRICLLRPLRHTEGTLRQGDNVSLIVNHFSVVMTNRVKLIYHYDVTISPMDESPKNGKIRRPKKKVAQDTETANSLPDRLLPLIWHEFQSVYYKDTKEKVAMPFDGKKNCYTVRKLNLGGQVEKFWSMRMIDPDDDDKIRCFHVRLKFTNDINVKRFADYMGSHKTRERVDLPQDVIQALDVALRSSPSNSYFCCNRSFFSNMKPYGLDSFLDLFYGHYQSLTPGSGLHPTLNVDLANKAFVRRMPLMKMLCTLFDWTESELDIKNWEDEHYWRASELMLGKLIEYGTGKKDPRTGKYEKSHKFPAVEFLRHTALNYRFVSDKGNVNIVEYFKNEKNTVIHHGNIPVLHIGSKSKTNYVPIELCMVTEQPYKGKMEPCLTSAMIKGAAKAPMERFQRIQTARNGCNFEKCTVLEAFGLSVSKQPVVIPNARHLNPPTILTRAKDVDPEKKTGIWSMKGRAFFKAAAVPECVILDTVGVKKADIIKIFFLNLSKEANTLGLKLKPSHSLYRTRNKYPSPAMLPAPNAKEAVQLFTAEVDRLLLDLKTNSNCKLVFIIISDDGREYPTVKSSAEVKVGILTACLKQKTLGGNAQTMGNFLLKLNAKLGGENFQLGRAAMEMFFKEPVLVMGADVTHPAPNSNTPSFAAVTASIGLSGMSFAMKIQAQTSKQEIIKDLKSTTAEMLKQYKRATGVQPKKILMFRDGVSEGYFDAIKEHEYMAIRDACLSLNPEYKPRITFVVVKKRHHTRFCPSDPKKDGVGRPMNVPPGTVVDQIITHPVEQEFFLNSHVGIQGTSKPTRYHVIHDDSKFSMDQIQQLSYYLCYMYVRCCQPVSYPAPTYYAHLAAFRARTLVNTEGESADLNALEKSLEIHPDLLKNYPMFFI